jgi:hypothetical protein
MSELNTYHYFKRPCEEIKNQSIVRAKFPIGNDYTNSELLIAGYLYGSGIPYGIFDLRYKTQTMLSPEDFTKVFINVLGWLTEINQEEFNKLFVEACNFLLPLGSKPKFHKMQEFPKRASGSRGIEEDFSIAVLVYDEDQPTFCEIGHYNFDVQKWSHFGDSSMKLICWCEIPDALEFINQNSLESVEHEGFLP